MSILSNLFKRQQPNQQAAIQASIDSMMEAINRLNGRPLYAEGTTANQLNNYANNGDLYAIIRLIAKTTATIPKYAYRIKDKKAYKQLQQIKAAKHDANFLERYQEKASQAYELDTDSELQKLIDNPCPLWDKTEFECGVYINRLTTGNSFLYLQKPGMGANGDKTIAMYHMPIADIGIICTTDFPKTILGYRMNTYQTNNVFTPNEVIHLKYFNPIMTFEGAELYGLSPLKAALKTVEKSNSAKDQQVYQFQNGGPAVVMGNEALQPNELGLEQAQKIRSYWDKNYAGVANRGKWALVPGKPNVIQLGSNLNVLGANDAERFTLSQLCNIYGVSDVLFNNNSAATESNVKEMVKRLYTNAALPEALSYCHGLTQQVAPAYGNYCVDVDLSDISELQENMLQKAQAAAASPIFIPNNVMEMLGYGRIEDGEMDKVFIKQGYTPIDEVGLNLTPNDLLGNNDRL